MTALPPNDRVQQFHNEVIGKTATGMPIAAAQLEVLKEHPELVRHLELAPMSAAVAYPPQVKVGAGALRGVLGLQADATDDAVLREIPLATPEVLARVRAALGLDPSASTTEMLAAAGPALAALRGALAGVEPSGVIPKIAARLRIDEAIRERRAHRSQRASLFALAMNNPAAFDALVSSPTIIGYRSAAEEYDALVEQEFRIRNEAPRVVENDVTSAAGSTIRAHNERIQRQADDKVSRTREAAQSAVAAAHPDLAAEVAFERSGATGHDVIRSMAGATLAAKIATYVAAGKTWAEGLELAAAEDPDVVRNYIAADLV